MICETCGSNSCFFFQFNQWREQQSGWPAREWWQCDTGGSDPSFSGQRTSTIAVRYDITPWRLEYSRLAPQLSLLALRVSVFLFAFFSAPVVRNVQECVNDAASCATETGKKPARFTKVAVGMETSDDEFGLLNDERCIDEGVFQNLYPLHELMFACSDILPRPHVSFILLTQSEWCALRTLARCEFALLPIVGAIGAGARVI